MMEATDGSRLAGGGVAMLTSAVRKALDVGATGRPSETTFPQTQNPAYGPGSAMQHATVKAHVNGSPLAVQTSMPPSASMVLSRLERVRKAGPGWSARCPAHQDRTASLSIAVGTDGRILVHCFAGCSTYNVLAAIGLTVGDLFPRRSADATPEVRKELQGLALRAQLRACANVLDHEAGVVLIAAGDLEGGQVLNSADRARLALAAERIRTARVAIGGAR